MYVRKLQKNFFEVLHNSYDQVFVRELLMELVPEDVQIEVVNRFNEYLAELNARKAER